jgi:NAD(P)-dependent dehydrogenase (short-subunit alcohol dehydrogenase family)
MSEGRRVAIVTGCGSQIGIGASCARTLAHRGIAVVVSDVQETGAQNDLNTASDANSNWRGLDSLVEEIKNAGGEAFSVIGDVSSEKDTQNMVAAAVSRYGKVDILVNNAAAPHGPDRNQIEDVPVEAWDRVMAINARGPFLMAKAAVPMMRKAGWGRIISMASETVVRAQPYRGAYSASKGAVVGLTKSLSVDLAPFGITVNAVCPGSVKTARAISTTRREMGDDLEAGLKARAKHIPIGRHAEPDEVASMVAYLASDEARYVTGQAISVNGGSAGSM